MPADLIWHNLLQQGWNVDVSGSWQDGEAIYIATARRQPLNNSPAERMKERISSVVVTAYSWGRAIEVLELKLNIQKESPLL